MKYVRGFAFSVLLGFIGGMICGSAILSLCALSGRIQTHGANYIGFWDPGLLLVGSMYGGPLGAALGPLAYVTIVRTTGFKQAMVPAALGTILGGYVGSLVAPGLGVPTGIIGFFIALLIIKFRYPNYRKQTAV
jgi:hypothetical protein